MTIQTVREQPTEHRERARGRSSLFVFRALHVLLWLLVLLGPASAVLVATRFADIDHRLTDIRAAIAKEEPADASGVEGFAELFISAYLTAGEGSNEVLDPFVAGVSLEGVEPGAWSVGQTRSLGAEEVAPGYYAVTVAVEVVPEDGYVETRFYSVGISEAETGWVVVGLPSLVPAPARATGPELLIERLDGLGSDPGIEDLLVRFLSAYLAGDGELSRYTAPSSSIAPVQPPPFVEIEIVESGVAEAADGSQVVAVSVRATDATGMVQLLEYWLATAQRDGRWEVTEALPAPPLASDARDQ